MIRFIFAIEGRPQGKGRPRFTKYGPVYTEKKTREYEEHVRQNFRKAGGEMIPKKNFITVRIVAKYKVPSSDTKETAAMKRDGILPVELKPDADNIAKVILDALNGEAWEDDSQVSSLSVVKEYSTDGNCVIVDILAFHKGEGGLWV